MSLITPPVFRYPIFKTLQLSCCFYKPSSRTVQWRSFEIIMFLASLSAVCNLDFQTAYLLSLWCPGLPEKAQFLFLIWEMKFLQNFTPLFWLTACFLFSFSMLQSFPHQTVIPMKFNSLAPSYHPRTKFASCSSYIKLHLCNCGQIVSIWDRKSAFSSHTTFILFTCNWHIARSVWDDFQLPFPTFQVSCLCINDVVDIQRRAILHDWNEFFREQIGKMCLCQVLRLALSAPDSHLWGHFDGSVNGRRAFETWSLIVGVLVSKVTCFQLFQKVLSLHPGGLHSSCQDINQRCS